MQVAEADRTHTVPPQDGGPIAKAQPYQPHSTFFA